MDEVYWVVPVFETLAIFFLSKKTLSNIKSPHSKVFLTVLLLAVIPALLLYFYAVGTWLSLPKIDSSGWSLFAVDMQLMAVSVWLVIPVLLTIITALIGRNLKPILLYILCFPVGLLEVGGAFWLLSH